MIAADIDCPVYDVDLYSDAVLCDPYPHYRALRELGPVIWLPQNALYALGRFEDVRAALRNPGLFSSAQGVAANDDVNEMSRGTTLASDAPLHDRLRAIIAAPLLPRALEEIGSADPDRGASARRRPRHPRRVRRGDGSGPASSAHHRVQAGGAGRLRPRQHAALGIGYLQRARHHERAWLRRNDRRSRDANLSRWSGDPRTIAAGKLGPADF
jgi:hypothetical protein